VQLPYLGKLLNLKFRRFSHKQLFVILINKVQQQSHVLAFKSSLCYTSSKQMFKMSPVCTHARCQSLPPLTNSQVNDVLLHIMPDGRGDVPSVHRQILDTVLLEYTCNQNADALMHLHMLLICDSYTCCCTTPQIL